MFKGLLSLLLVASTYTVSAETLEEVLVKEVIQIEKIQKSTMAQAGLLGLEWKIGDNNDYSIVLGSFIKGTMHSFVREKVEDTFWVQQDMDLGAMGKQKVEILFDALTGQVLEIRANDQKQDLPNPEDYEVIKMEEANVSVPAGSFDCIHVVVRDKKKNSDSEAWINPELIPISGMLQQEAPSQFGKVVVKLTAYEKKN